MIQPQRTSQPTFSKPQHRVRTLSPLLIVFGVALVGVLVEAFVAAPHRYLVQTVLTLVGVVGALVATVIVASDLAPTRRHGRPAAQIAAEGAIAVDGPTVFIWGTILVLVADQRAAVRRAPPRGRHHRLRRPGRGAARHRGRARGVHARASSTPRSSR